VRVKEGLRDIENPQKLGYKPSGLITALIAFALWLVGLNLKGLATERQIKVNSRQKHSPYSAIFLGRIVIRAGAGLFKFHASAVIRLFQYTGKIIIRGDVSGNNPNFLLLIMILIIVSIIRRHYSDCFIPLWDYLFIVRF